MLIGKAIFKEDGTLIESELPNIVVGDKDSVRLNVSFFEDYENSKLLDLSTYVVEAVFERPDGIISPALLLSIDINTENIKYLVFGNWLTEIAGIAQVTIRLKENDTVKSTGFLNITIKDGNTPSDVVITEPQYDALSEAITAEESARILAVNEALTQSKEYTNTKLMEFKNYVDALIYNLQVADSNLLGEINANKENIANNLSAISAHTKELSELASKVVANTTAINGHTQQIANNTVDIGDNRSRIIELTNSLSEAYDILETKLNKVWIDVAVANELGDNDYFIINSGSNAYKITFSQFKNLVGGSGGVNHYKGDFLSYSALLNATYDGTITPQAGDYAFVNTTDYTTEMPKDYLVMYIWDVDADTWKETTSDKYVQSIVFDEFQYNLLNGLFVVQSATHADNADNADNAAEATIAHFYINSDEVESSISESFDSKQDKLTAGAGISISNDGVISVSYPDGDEEVY